MPEPNQALKLHEVSTPELFFYHNDLSQYNVIGDETTPLQVDAILHQENSQSIFGVFEVFTKTSKTIKTQRLTIFSKQCTFSREDPSIFERYLYLC